MGAGKIAAALWLIMFIAVSARIVHQPLRNNVFPTYRLAGEHWLHAQPLYEGAMGFVYGPLVAATMAPFALLPQTVGDVLWRLLSVLAFLTALAAWWRSGLPPRCGWPAILILLVPFSLGNLNNGQANLIVIALLVGATAAVQGCHWMTGAFCIVSATYLKIYPLALGLLFFVIYPRQIGWRLILALLVFALVTFVLQQPSYVASQYRLWLATRVADNRLHWASTNAPQDLWRLLQPLRVSEGPYLCIRITTALSLAAILWRGRHWSRERMVVSAFAFGCAWMILCGPATESATYVLLAPALVFALVQAFTVPFSGIMRAWIGAILLCELFVLAVISFTPWRHSFIVLLQPFGALLFFGYGLCWALSDYAWNPKTTPE